MPQYERDTWYDLHGRIIFTTSKGLVGVGLPRKGGTAQPRARITLPDDTVAQQCVQDDTLPTSPYCSMARKPCGQPQQNRRTG